MENDKEVLRINLRIRLKEPALSRFGVLPASLKKAILEEFLSSFFDRLSEEEWKELVRLGVKGDREKAHDFIVQRIKPLLEKKEADGESVKPKKKFKSIEEFL